ncbi:hypothetical protein NHN17_03870 [Photobacterium sp. ZSDE20]|uniref:Uncharacterized protein n=1 Tax=Photobacterium pectinilyticum TaxID=2906793 RepID=A0ABT1MXI9_9GAMM|nr:hypothetical protein [Photobacterium sp. ZSDE20]MCQ1057213.1 hypothetical protein [Photobacterium sp. ZSDE20]
MQADESKIIQRLNDIKNQYQLFDASIADRTSNTGQRHDPKSPAELQPLRHNASQDTTSTQ